MVVQRGALDEDVWTSSRSDSDSAVSVHRPREADLRARVESQQPVDCEAIGAA